MPSPDATKRLINRANEKLLATAASSAVTNTTTETQFSTCQAINANTIVPGTTIKVFFQVIATATNSTDTLQIQLRLREGTEALSSATVVLAGTAVDVDNNDIVMGEATIQFRTVGASGTFVSAGWITLASQEGTADGFRHEFTASTAVDTTGAITPSVTATWSVADAGNSCRMDVYRVEVLRP